MSVLSVVIPTKEEAECLPRVVEELKSVAGRYIREIIVVDAGSRDGTAEIAKALGCRVLIQKEPGYGAAVTLGLKNVSGSLVTFFDADGSYDPEFLNLAVEKINQQKLNAVFCTRYHPQAGSDDDTWIRQFGNFFFSFLLRVLFGARITDALHLNVVAETTAARSLKMESQDFSWCLEFPLRLHRQGFRYEELPMRERPRLAGESKVHAFLDGWKILLSIIKWRLSI